MIPSGAVALCASRPSRRATSLDGCLAISCPSSRTRARARLEHAGERAQQRRLAARVRADDRREAAVGDLDVEALGDDALVVGEREVSASVEGHARPPPLGRQQPDEVDAADRAGHDADRERRVGHDPLGGDVGGLHDQRAGDRRADQRRLGRAQHALGDLRRGERDERDRADRRRRRRHQADRERDQRGARALDRQAEPVGGVVAELERPQRAAGGRGERQQDGAGDQQRPDLLPGAAVEASRAASASPPAPPRSGRARA